MRVIVAGSRSIFSSLVVEESILAARDQGIDITTLLSGTACGVDKLGERYARAHLIPIEQYPADWNRHGKSAGYKRNEEMAKNAEALIAVWDGKSKGTEHMIELARKHGLKVFVQMVEKNGKETSTGYRRYQGRVGQKAN